MFRLLRAR